MTTQSPSISNVDLIDLPATPPAALEMRSLEVIPSMFSLYRSAILKRTFGLKRDEDLTTFGARGSLMISSEWYAQYLEVCQWTGERLPLTAAQVFAAPIQTVLLTDSRCQIPTLGLVHAGNEIYATAALPLDTPLEVSVWFGETRWKERGVEFDLHTAVNVSGDSTPVWRARTMIFRTVKASKSPRKPRGDRPTEPLLHMDDGALYDELNLPPNLGRRYGKVAQDRNPIHLYPWTAKLFGFDRPIIHGMWNLARALSLHGDTSHFERGTLEVRFKRPVPLPSTARFTRLSDPETRTLRFQTLTQEGKVALEGAFTETP